MTTLATCETRMVPKIISENSEIRIPSRIARAEAYSPQYSQNTDPRSKGRFFQYNIRIPNTIKFQTDSIKNSAKCHSPLILTAGGNSASWLETWPDTEVSTPPYSSWLKKFPHLPIACAKIKEGAAQSSKSQKDILRHLAMIKAAIIPPMTAP